VRSHGRLEDGKGTGRELILFELCNLVLARLGFIVRYSDSGQSKSGGRGAKEVGDFATETYVSSLRDLVRSSLNKVSGCTIGSGGM
jgi:hypothetical protein